MAMTQKSGRFLRVIQLIDDASNDDGKTRRLVYMTGSFGIIVGIPVVGFVLPAIYALADNLEAFFQSILLLTFLAASKLFAARATKSTGELRGPSSEISIPR
jgi:hypothetical protein